MEAPVLIELVQTFAEPLTITSLLLVMVYVIYQKLDKVQEQNKQDLKRQIDDLKVETKSKDKIFRETIKEFSRSIDEFRLVNQQLSEMRSEIKEIKDDVKHLKTK